MINFELLRKTALAFPEASEEPHFDKTSFRVKKKIFATYNRIEHRACIKLSAIDQHVFCQIQKEIIYPVNNKWGKQGWTLINLQHVDEAIFMDALTTAYCNVAPPNLAQIIRPK